MYQLIIVVHVLLGLAVIGLILMQQGKGADAGAAFGSGSSGSVFGAQGSASFLSRTTAILATLFFSTSLGLAILAGHQGKAKDIMDTTEIEQKASDVPAIAADKVPAVPVTVAPTADVPAVSSDNAQSKEQDASIESEKAVTADVPNQARDSKTEGDVETKQLADKKVESNNKPSEDEADENKPARDKKETANKKADKK